MGIGVAVAATVGLLAAVDPAGAHTPHDVIVDVAVSPAFASDSTVLTISDNRVLRSTDGGRHFRETLAGLDPTVSMARFGFAPSKPRVVYLTSRGAGVYRSDDGGLHWRSTTDSAESRNTADLAVSPRSPDVVVVRGGIFGALARTDDGGRSWANVPGMYGVGALGISPRPGRSRRRRRRTRRHVRLRRRRADLPALAPRRVERPASPPSRPARTASCSPGPSPARSCAAPTPVTRGAQSAARWRDHRSRRCSSQGTTAATTRSGRRRGTAGRSGRPTPAGRGGRSTGASPVTPRPTRSTRPSTGAGRRARGLPPAAVPRRLRRSVRLGEPRRTLGRGADPGGLRRRPRRLAGLPRRPHGGRQHLRQGRVRLPQPRQDVLTAGRRAPADRTHGRQQGPAAAPHAQRRVLARVRA